MGAEFRYALRHEDGYAVDQDTGRQDQGMLYKRRARIEQDVGKFKRFK